MSAQPRKSGLSVKTIYIISAISAVFSVIMTVSIIKGWNEDSALSKHKILMAQTKKFIATAKYQKAADILEKVIADISDVNKQYEPLYLNELGSVYYKMRQYQKGEQLLLRALAIDEKVLDKDHPKIAAICNNLGAIYLAVNRLDEAEQFILRALAIDEKALGKDHRDVARDCNNLGQLYKKTKRFKEAEPLLLRAVAIMKNLMARIILN